MLEQLRLRQLSLEQVETYSKQVTAAQNLRVLNEAQAQAQMQTQLTNSLVQIRIAENEAEAQLARARKQAEQVVVTAQAESQQRILAGRGEGARILQEGLSEASVLLRKIHSFSDPRLYALSVVAQNLARMHPAARPRAGLHRRRGGWQRSLGGENALTGGASAGSGLMGLLLSLLVAEKSGFQLAEQPAASELSAFTDQVTRQAMESIQQAVGAGGPMPAEHQGNGTAKTAAVVTVAQPHSRLDGLDLNKDGA